MRIFSYLLNALLIMGSKIKVRSRLTFSQINSSNCCWELSVKRRTSFSWRHWFIWYGLSPSHLNSQTILTSISYLLSYAMMKGWDNLLVDCCKRANAYCCGHIQEMKDFLTKIFWNKYVKQCSAMTDRNLSLIILTSYLSFKLSLIWREVNSALIPCTCRSSIS